MTTTFFSRLLCLDPEMVKRQPTASRLKIITLGQLMLIPMMLWFISGFLISKNLSGTSLIIAMIVGSFCAALIYIIDCSFITSIGNKSKWAMNLIRLGFAILSAILGSMSLDVVLFDADIQSFQSKKAELTAESYQDSIKIKYSDELEALQLKESESYTKYGMLLEDYINEIDGKGTGYVGVGKAAKAKKKVADSAEKDWKSAQLNLTHRKNEIDSIAKAYGETQAATSEGAFLQKLHDFHQFVLSSRLNIIIYSIFFSLMLLIESMLIIYKIGARETVLENLILAEEDARNAEMESIKMRKAELEAARRLLGHKAVFSINTLTKN